jgi:nucleolin
MDFKSILSKLDSMDAPIVTPAAPTIAKAVQLNEDAQLRVLAGQTTYVAEAKKKKDEEVKEEMKVGDKKPSSTGGTIEKTATGVKHTAGKNYGGSKAETDSDDEDDKPAKKKAKKESIEPEFKSKFMKMVEAKKEEAADKKKADAKKKKMDEAKKPDEDGDGVPDWADEKPGEDDNAGKKKDGKKGMSAKQAKYFGKKESVEEAAEKTATTWTDMKGNKHPATKVKGDKYTGKEAEKEDKKSKKDESAMMPKGKKRPVKESVEQKLTFREMMTLVVESGGQQQIDAVDQELFAWAQRVAKQKLGEGMKAEVYAGMVYERMGGVFEMYDVLAEDQN